MPTVPAATFVLSDNGDIASPKYAPPIIGAAIISGFIPMLNPTPIRATPAVPQVPNDVPVNNEKIIHIKNDIIKKYLGLIVRSHNFVISGTVPQAFHVPIKAPTHNTIVIGTNDLAAKVINPVCSSL